jgi:hypothetical protein
MEVRSLRARLGELTGVIISVGVAAALSAGALSCGGGGAAAPGGSDAGIGIGVDGAGAPVVAAPDLRFKWVGAPFSIRAAGLTNAGTGIGSTTGFHGQGFWSALALSGGGSHNYFSFSTDENLEMMSGTVTSGALSEMVRDLDELQDWRGIIVSLDSGDFGATPPGYVYSALLLRTDSDLVAYDPYVRGAIAPSSVAAWAADQASRGVVVTALCPATTDVAAGGGSGLVQMMAFGRRNDTTTYETQVALAPYDALGAQLEAMAAGGYIVTALGRDGTGTNGAGNFIAVGTRVTGQTTPRAIQIVEIPCVPGAGDFGTPLDTLLKDGYALVGEIFHGSGTCDGSPAWALIGQR